MATGKTLVAYFSATGTTERIAQEIASAVGADIEKIEPAVPYTAADLNWNDKKSRTTIEMSDPTSRPELASAPGDISAYETVLLGFPIWWYTAPHVISAWVEAASLDGKRVMTFATSGGSGMCTSTEDLAKLAPGASWVDGKVLRSASDARTWASGLKLGS